MSPAELQLKELLMAMFATDPEGFRFLCYQMDGGIAQIAEEHFPASVTGMSLSAYFEACLTALESRERLQGRHVATLCDALVARTPMREQQIRRIQAALVAEEGS